MGPPALHIDHGKHGPDGDKVNLTKLEKNTFGSYFTVEWRNEHFLNVHCAIFFLQPSFFFRQIITVIK